MHATAKSVTVWSKGWYPFFLRICCRKLQPINARGRQKNMWSPNQIRKIYTRLAKMQLGGTQKSSYPAVSTFLPHWKQQPKSKNVKVIKIILERGTNKSKSLGTVACTVWGPRSSPTMTPGSLLPSRVYNAITDGNRDFSVLEILLQRPTPYPFQEQCCAIDHLEYLLASTRVLTI